MLPSTLISPAAASAAAIVGTPPTAQRSASDGRPAPESFAMALNQASSPPPPAAPPRPDSAHDEERSDAAAADAATARAGAAQQTEHAAAACAPTQRRTAAQAGTGVDKNSPTPGLTIGLPPAGAEPGLLPAQTRDGTSLASSPSAMIRIRGSVPEARTTKRPDPLRRSSASAMTALT